MTLDEFIEQLKEVRKKEGGDILVRTVSLTHTWVPSLRVKRVDETKKVLILND